jgi:pilus assembly protein CpaE
MLKESISILMVGSDKAELERQRSNVAALLEKEVTSLLLEDSLQSLPFSQKNHPDILIFLLNKTNAEVLNHLASLPKAVRPALLIISMVDDNNLMRLAMQAGARDFFTVPVDEREFHKALSRIVADCQYVGDGSPGVLTTVINAKGGSGGSLIACNLAHIATVASNAKVVLIDMDLQFGTQSLLLDLRPEHSMVEALNEIGVLDATALDAHMAKHRSNLRLLSVFDENIVLPGDISVESVNQLLAITLNNYDRIFVDLPRLIDPVSAAILDKSDQIIIVVQQTLSHMRDAKRLIKILKNELSVPDKNILVLVNRYNPNSSLQLKDIQATLDELNIVMIPNDYERVASATNLGVPLFEYARSAPITQAMLELAEVLEVKVHPSFKKISFFKSLFTSSVNK